MRIERAVGADEFALGRCHLSSTVDDPPNGTQFGCFSNPAHQINAQFSCGVQATFGDFGVDRTGHRRVQQGRVPATMDAAHGVEDFRAWCALKDRFTIGD